jgi:hypothetical protein
MYHNQKVTGSVLYYAIAVDPTVLMPLNNIATEQTKATEKTQAATNKLLDYLATHPDATIRYQSSDMISHIHSDDSYLSVSNARSRLGGLFFLGNKSPKQDMLNGYILNVASVIKNMVASAAESEVGACFHNAQSGAPLRVTLTELGHTQTPTPLRIDNSTAFGILNETIKQKRSKAMDMRYHWLTDRVPKNNLTFIGDQDVKISQIITQNIIQRNITKIYADSYYIKQIVFRFCEGVLNYSHSRNPHCAPAWTHRQIQAPREPPN